MLRALFPVFATLVQSHLIVGDPQSAVSAAREACELSPCAESTMWLIRSLAAAGRESEMMEVWERFHAEDPKGAHERELLEEMCWGIISKGKKAPGAQTRLISLIGAALTQDVRAVRVLEEGLRNSNSFIRCVAVQLAALYGDYPLRKEITRLFRQERSWEVRQHLLRAVGVLRMKELTPELMEILSSGKSSSDEKKEALKALVALRDTAKHEEVAALVGSPRSALRGLACACILACDLEGECGLLGQLTDDINPEVRSEAWKTLGLLRLEPPPFPAQIKDPTVGIPAAWACLLAGREEAVGAFDGFLTHEKQEVRAKAAAALAAAGHYGIPLAKEYIAKSTDPYVRANLALALIGQRVDVQEAAAELDHFLQTQSEQLVKEEGHFASLKKSDLIHNPAIPNFPEVVNQTTRLEILNTLAIVDYPGAGEAIKRFLKERRWGVTGLAAELLLGEGDESALDLVRELLDDPDPLIACEAALVLATWGKDTSALPTLMNAYHGADRQMKIKILESLGRVGDHLAVPFLIERLKEPSQTIRIIAACVLMQTLNH